MKFAKKIKLNKATKQAKKLYAELKKLDVECILEYWDGKKHIDICLPEAKIFIEVDGSQHYDNPDQILRDFKRDYWSSTKEGFHTIHIPNEKIEEEAGKIAKALVEVVERIKAKNSEIYM